MSSGHLVAPPDIILYPGWGHTPPLLANEGDGGGGLGTVLVDGIETNQLLSTGNIYAYKSVGVNAALYSSTRVISITSGQGTFLLDKNVNGQHYMVRKATGGVDYASILLPPITQNLWSGFHFSVHLINIEDHKFRIWLNQGQNFYKGTGGAVGDPTGLLDENFVVATLPGLVETGYIELAGEGSYYEFVYLGQWHISRRGVVPLSSANYLPSGGVEFDILMKQSATNGDADWNATVSLYGVPPTEQTKLQTTGNWTDNDTYTGAGITGTFQGQMWYDANFWFIATADNVWKRIARGGSTNIVDDTTPQLGGNLDLNSKQVYVPTPTAKNPTTQAATLNFDTEGPVFLLDMASTGGDLTLTLQNYRVSPYPYRIFVKSNAAGNDIILTPAPANGATVSLPSVSGQVVILDLLYDGANLWVTATDTGAAAPVGGFNPLTYALEYWMDARDTTGWTIAGGTNQITQIRDDSTNNHQPVIRNAGWTYVTDAVDINRYCLSASSNDGYRFDSMSPLMTPVGTGDYALVLVINHGAFSSNLFGVNNGYIRLTPDYLVREDGASVGEEAFTPDSVAGSKYAYILQRVGTTAKGYRYNGTTWHTTADIPAHDGDYVPVDMRTAAGDKLYQWMLFRNSFSGADLTDLQSWLESEFF